jgi:hypothetical protein
MEQIPEFLKAFSQVSVSVDVFPYAKDEMARIQAEDNQFILRALSDGVELGLRN